MEPAAFAHWRSWQVPLRRAAIFRLSAIACWLPSTDNRSIILAPLLKRQAPWASIYAYCLLHCTSPLLAQSGHPATELQCPLLGAKRTPRQVWIGLDVFDFGI